MKIISKVLDCVEDAILFIGIAIMIIMNFLNVVCRYLLPQTPFSYTEELTVTLFLWVTMFGVACGFKRVSHTGFSLITERISINAQKVAIVIATLLTSVFIIIVINSGFTLVRNNLRFGNVLPGLKISTAYASAAIPSGGIVILLRVLQAGYTQLMAKNQKTPDISTII